MHRYFAWVYHTCACYYAVIMLVYTRVRPQPDLFVGLKPFLISTPIHIDKPAHQGASKLISLQGGMHT
jgi:hypothetical protein